MCVYTHTHTHTVVPCSQQELFVNPHLTIKSLLFYEVSGCPSSMMFKCLSSSFCFRGAGEVAFVLPCLYITYTAPKPSIYLTVSLSLTSSPPRASEDIQVFFSVGFPMQVLELRLCFGGSIWMFLLLEKEFHHSETSFWASLG